MDWKTRDEMMVYLKAAIAAKYEVTVDKVRLAASGLDSNEAAADGTRRVGELILNQCDYVRGYAMFYVDGDPLDVVIRLGFVRQRASNAYRLDPSDRATQTVFGPVPTATFEDKVKAALPAAYWYMGMEYGTVDACVVKVVKKDVTPGVECRGAAKLNEDGTVIFKLL
jgi:hypothetical protein